MRPFSPSKILLDPKTLSSIEAIEAAFVHFGSLVDSASPSFLKRARRFNMVYMEPLNLYAVFLSLAKGLDLSDEDRQFLYDCSFHYDLNAAFKAMSGSSGTPCHAERYFNDLMSSFSEVSDVSKDACSPPQS